MFPIQDPQAVPLSSPSGQQQQQSQCWDRGTFPDPRTGLCPVAEMPQDPLSLCQDPHPASGSSSGVLEAQGHLAVNALIYMVHF